MFFYHSFLSTTRCCCCWRFAKGSEAAGLLWGAANRGGSWPCASNCCSSKTTHFIMPFVLMSQNRIASQKNSRKGKTQRNFELEFCSWTSSFYWAEVLGFELGFRVYSILWERERESMATSTSGSLLAYSGGCGLTRSSPLVPGKILPNCFFYLTVDAG